MTASIAAFEGQIGQAAYSASKGGVVALTLAARPRNWPVRGIRGDDDCARGVSDSVAGPRCRKAAIQSLSQQVPVPLATGPTGKNMPGWRNTSSKTIC